MLFQRFRQYIRSVLTVMIVPHGQQQIHTFRIPVIFLYCIALTLTILISWAILIVSNDIQYQDGMKALQEFKDEKKCIVIEIEKGKSSLQRIAKMENYLRNIIKKSDLKTKKSIIENKGQGGPSETDLAVLQKLLETKKDVRPEELIQQVEQLNKTLDERERSLASLTMSLTTVPFGWPVKGWVTSTYGERVSPMSGEAGNRHWGIDIANMTGTPVRATGDGVVTFIGKEGGYGKLVVIQHGMGYTTRYGHNSIIKVQVGQKVQRGEVISYMGATGNATGPHCHYEIRKYGIPVDPLNPQYGCIY